MREIRLPAFDLLSCQRPTLELHEEVVMLFDLYSYRPIVAQQV